MTVQNNYILRLVHRQTVYILFKPLAFSGLGVYTQKKKDSGGTQSFKGATDFRAETVAISNSIDTIPRIFELCNIAF